MKCINCDQDSPFKDRASGRCSHCGTKFAFEPKSGDPVTDGAFLSAIVAASGTGRVYFLRENVHYELCRRIAAKKRKENRGCGCALLFVPTVFPLALMLMQSPQVIYLQMVFVAVAAIVALLPVPKRVPITKADFQKLWEKWIGAHGDPKNVIVRREPKGRARIQEADLGDYSFDRAVICDRSETVDLLVANHFHFENNCAVLSVDGYPPQAFDTVRAMLKRNPKLKVYVLHDCTPAGCTLAWRLVMDPEWFAGHGEVVDVGLRPAQARHLRAGLLPSPGAQPAPGLTDEEVRWLSAQQAELAVLPPEQVLKRLFRAITRPVEEFQREEMDDAHIWIDLDSFSSDSGTVDGGGDDGFG